MRTVFLLRHAKSDWSDGSLDDHARPLNSRGKGAAVLMAKYCRTKAYEPDVILCSTARRTVQTLDLVRPHLTKTPVIRYEDTLYLATQQKLLERLQWIDAPFSSAMLIGHNPGMEQLARALARTSSDAAEKARSAVLQDKYPTAALAVLTFGVKTWKALSPGGGTLIDFVRPKDLDGVDSD